MSNFQSQMASHDAKLVAMYSALAKLSAIDFCFLLNQEIALDPKLKQQLEVFFLSVVLPAQSTSE
jgi:hypothetical protein